MLASIFLSPRYRCWSHARMAAAIPLCAVAAAWPSLVAAPIVGGPMLALAVGIAAWSTARFAAAPAHANDNASRLLSPVGAGHARRTPHVSGARTMLGGGSKTEPRRAGGLSVIGADVTVTGNIATQGDLHVDGIVEGDIACGALIQGASSRIVGTVTAKSARLAGAIEGQVSAATLIVEKSARLRGDAQYQTLQIENGAQVDGRLTHLTGDGRAAESPLRLVDASDAG